MISGGDAMAPAGNFEGPAAFNYTCSAPPCSLILGCVYSAHKAAAALREHFEQFCKSVPSLQSAVQVDV